MGITIVHTKDIFVSFHRIVPAALKWETGESAYMPDDPLQFLGPLIPLFVRLLSPSLILNSALLLL